MTTQPILIDIPGDKSISHRALILSAISNDTVRIKNLLESEDVLTTLQVLRDLGVSIIKEDDIWIVKGVGLRGLKKPDKILYMGNSGTTCRLMMGILAGQDFGCCISGDESLSQRPMDRVVEPLQDMGANIFYMDEVGKLPIAIRGSKLKPFSKYKLETPSAQVKGAVILASLYTDEEEICILPNVKTREHTEEMLRDFGVCEPECLKRTIKAIKGEIVIKPGDLHYKNSLLDVKRDYSSASFFMVASYLLNKPIRMHNVYTGSMRCGLSYIFEYVLNTNFITESMVIETFPNKRIKDGDYVVTADYAPMTIDEYPILMALSATVNGSVKFEGIGELRHKECDRIAVMEKGLKACGVDVETGEDWMIIRGNGTVKGGVEIETHGDHRIAMTFAVLSLVSEEDINVDNMQCVDISFPNFYIELCRLKCEAVLDKKDT